MKLKDDVVISNVADQTVAISVSPDKVNDLMITTNGTGAFLLELLRVERSQEDLVNEMLKKYEVDSDTAQQHVSKFVDGLREVGFLVE